MTRNVPLPCPTLSGESRDLAFGPQAFCALPPLTQCLVAPEVCRCGRRALSWGGREPRCGRQQAGGQATTAGLAVVSVSKLVLGRGKG